MFYIYSWGFLIPIEKLDRSRYLGHADLIAAGCGTRLVVLFAVVFECFRAGKEALYEISLTKDQLTAMRKTSLIKQRSQCQQNVNVKSQP